MYVCTFEIPKLFSIFILSKVWLLCLYRYAPFCAFVANLFLRQCCFMRQTNMVLALVTLLGTLSLQSNFLKQVCSHPQVFMQPQL